ncbi:MAG: hypothetical protein ACKVX7_01040 [Planctomycetota bacterium]
MRLSLPVFALVAMASAYCATPVRAGGSPYTLRLDSPAGVVGGEATVRVSLDFPTATVSLAGWSFGVCDAGPIELLYVEDGATTLGIAPDFNQISVLADGFTVGVVLDFFGVVTLPPGSGYELNRAHFQLLRAGTAAVAFCDSLGSPPVSTVVVVAGGGTFVPEQLPGTIAIGTIPPLLLRAGSTLGGPGQAVSVAIELDSIIDIDGLAFGLSHDGAVATLTSIHVGATLAALNGGAGPDFLYANITPTGGIGGTFSCLVSLAPPISELVAGPGLGIANFVYQVSSTASSGTSSALNFSGALGMPPVGVAMAADGFAVTPQTEPGVIEVQGEAVVLLRRGDVNVDGVVSFVDAIALANFLFSSGPSPGCDDVSDANDNGAVAIDDVIYLLNYFFIGGPAVPTPSSACGIDTTTDSLTCTGFSGCP